VARAAGSQARAVRRDASLDELRAENQRLRRELRRAELEREILKTATAYFAKESL
jgi:transposase